MEARNRVSVKYGKPRWYLPGDEETKEIVFTSSEEDARDRLTRAFPQVEDVVVETRETKSVTNESEKISVQSSAYGYIVKGAKPKVKQYKIKDTELYKLVTGHLNKTDAEVLRYSIRYHEKWESENYVQFAGKGPIDWEKIETCINEYNANDKVTNNRKGYHGKYLFINPNNFYKDTCTINGIWTGTVVLSDGSWLAIEEEYGAYNDEYYCTVNKYSPPSVEDIECEFLFTTSKNREKEE